MRLALAAALAALASSAFAADGFVFSGSEVRGPRTGQVVTLRGKTSLADLTGALSPYTVKLSNECDGFCVQVSHQGRELIQIYLDERKGTISGITSYDPGARDVLGNKIGDGLARTIGAQPVICDQGESTFCNSNAVRGLSYVPSSGAGCDILPVSGAKAAFQVPGCVLIDGFAIWRSR